MNSIFFLKCFNEQCLFFFILILHLYYTSIETVQKFFMLYAQATEHVDRKLVNSV